MPFGGLNVTKQVETLKFILVPVIFCPRCPDQNEECMGRILRGVTAATGSSLPLFQGSHFAKLIS